MCSELLERPFQWTMSTKFGSQHKQSPEDNTGGGRTNTSASRYNHMQVWRADGFRAFSRYACRGLTLSPMHILQGRGDELESRF